MTQKRSARAGPARVKRITPVHGETGHRAGQDHQTGAMFAKNGKSAFSQILRPTTVKEEVYRKLREQLVSGRAAPSERIVEIEVTKQLGVSRTPVREALARLASEGFLVGTRYGYHVPEFSPADVANLSEVRLLLEPVAARQATEHIPDTELRALRQIVAEERRAHAVADSEAFLHAHHRFREIWLNYASNPLLIEALARTLHSLSLIRQRTMSDVELRKFIVTSHGKLVAAFEARNPERAARIQVETIEKFAALVSDRIFNEGKSTPRRGSAKSRNGHSGKR